MNTAAEPSAAEVAQTAPPTPEAPPAEAPTPDPTGMSMEDLQQALSDTRKEAADRRVQYAPFRDAFDGLSGTEVDFVLSAVAGLRGGDPGKQEAAVEKWLDIGVTMAGEETFGGWVSQLQEFHGGDAGAPETPAPVETPALTADAVAKMVAETLRQDRVEQQSQQKKSDVQVEADTLIAAAKEAGFKPGTVEYGALFQIAIDNGMGLDDALSKYKDTFGRMPGEGDPTPAPKVPRTGADIPSGKTPETPATSKLTPREKMLARINAQVGE